MIQEIEDIRTLLAIMDTANRAVLDCQKAEFEYQHEVERLEWERKRWDAMSRSK